MAKQFEKYNHYQQFLKIKPQGTIEEFIEYQKFCDEQFSIENQTKFYEKKRENEKLNDSFQKKLKITLYIIIPAILVVIGIILVKKHIDKNLKKFEKETEHQEN